MVVGGGRSSVARALAAKARCPGFDSRRRHSLSSHMLLQRSTDSYNAGCVLLTHCQEVFALSLLPSCLSLDVALFQRPSCVHVKEFLPAAVSFC